MRNKTEQDNPPSDKADKKDDEKKILVDSKKKDKDEIEINIMNVDETPEPELVISNKSLVVGNHGIKSSQIGISGLKLELFNIQSLLLDGLKKRGCTYSKDREGKRAWENSVKNAENLQEIRSAIIELEAVVRSVQLIDDEDDDVEAEREKVEARAVMVTEGWKFKEEKKEEKKEDVEKVVREERKLRGKRGREETEFNEIVVNKIEKEVEKEAENGNDYTEQMKFLGKPLRRFFKGHGKSDGILVGYLPADKNEGMELWRMEHQDGDEEDLDLDDVIKSLRWYDLNLFEDDEIVIDGEEEEDDDNDSDDVIIDNMNDDTNELERTNGESTRTLWPTGGVRSRWLDALQQSKTISEVVLALTSFLEHSRLFGMMDDDEPDLYSSNQSRSKSSNNTLYNKKNNDNKSKSMQIQTISSSPYKRKGKGHVEPEMGRAQRAAARRIVSYAE